jgi:FtsH-binding integral membrane protein
MTEIGGKSMRWIDEIRKDIASIQSSPKDLKKFGLMVGGVLLLISGLAMWKQWWAPYLISIIGMCGVVLVFVGALRPLSLKVIHHYWMGFALIMGNIVSRIILFVLFYFILTPLAGAAKVFDKRFFLSYKEKKRSSYWIDRENKKVINYERMS